MPSKPTPVLGVYRAIVEVEVNIAAYDHNAAWSDAVELKDRLGGVVSETLAPHKCRAKYLRVSRLHKLHKASKAGRNL